MNRDSRIATALRTGGLFPRGVFAILARGALFCLLSAAAISVLPAALPAQAIHDQNDQPILAIIVDTPTATLTPPTKTPTVTRTGTQTPTFTPVVLPTATATGTATPTSSPVALATATVTATPTRTGSPTSTWTPIAATHTATATPTRTWTPIGDSPTATATGLPGTPTFTGTPTDTPTVTSTATATSTSSATATATGSATATATVFATGPAVVGIAEPDGLKVPNALVIDKAHGVLYVVARDTSEVIVLSLATLDIVTRIPVGNRPYGAALLDGILYVANFDDATVSRIDTATNTRLLPDIHVGPMPTWIDVDALTGKVFVVTKGNNGVAVIRWGSLHTIFGAGAGAFAIAVDEAGRRGYVTHRDDNMVTVFNVDTHAVLGILKPGGSAFGVAVNEVTGDVYVMHGLFPADCPARYMTTYTRAGAWLREATLGDSCDGGWLDVNDLNGRVYLAATALNEVWITYSDSVVRAVLGLADGVGGQPFGLAVDSAAHRVYFGNKGDNTVRVIHDPW